jgi:hypothetical protein
MTDPRLADRDRAGLVRIGVRIPTISLGHSEIMSLAVPR